MKKISKQTFFKGFLLLFVLVFLYHAARPALTRLHRIGAASVPSLREDKPQSSGGLPEIGMRDKMQPEMAALKEAAASPVAQADPLQNEIQTTDDLYRKIVKSAELSIQVKNLDKAYDAITSAAGSVSGYVLRSSFEEEGSTGPRTASIILEVPSSRFDAALGAVGGIGKVTRRSISGQDVTGEYTDLQARLKNLSNVEVQFTELLSRAKTINEILTVQDRLNQVQAEIERAKARLQLLSHESAMSEITIDLTQIVPIVSRPAPGFLASLGHRFLSEMKSSVMAAMTAFAQTVSTLVVLLIWVLGYLLPILILGLLGWKLAVKYGKAFKTQIG